MVKNYWKYIQRNKRKEIQIWGSYYVSFPFYGYVLEFVVLKIGPIRETEFCYDVLPSKALGIVKSY